MSLSFAKVRAAGERVHRPVKNGAPVGRIRSVVLLTFFLEIRAMNRRSSAVFTAVVSMLAVSIPLAAHHGAASFDVGKELVLKGVVTEWTWANPHCFLKFDAKDETGMVRSWAVETQNPTDMTKRGWRRNSFKPGDEVTVTLEPVKNGAPVGRVRSVVLANGETLSAGGPPPGAGAAAPAQPPR